MCPGSLAELLSRHKGTVSALTILPFAKHPPRKLPQHICTPCTPWQFAELLSRHKGTVRELKERLEKTEQQLQRLEEGGQVGWGRSLIFQPCKLRPGARARTHLQPSLRLGVGWCHLARRGQGCMPCASLQPAYGCMLAWIEVCDACM